MFGDKAKRIKELKEDLAHAKKEVDLHQTIVNDTRQVTGCPENLSLASHLSFLMTSKKYDKRALDDIRRKIDIKPGELITDSVDRLHTELGQLKKERLEIRALLSLTDPEDTITCALDQVLVESAEDKEMLQVLRDDLKEHQDCLDIAVEEKHKFAYDLEQLRVIFDLEAGVDVVLHAKRIMDAFNTNLTLLMAAAKVFAESEKQKPESKKKRVGKKTK